VFVRLTIAGSMLFWVHLDFFILSRWHTNPFFNCVVLNSGEVSIDRVAIVISMSLNPMIVKLLRLQTLPRWITLKRELTDE